MEGWEAVHFVCARWCESIGGREGESSYGGDVHRGHHDPRRGDQHAHVEPREATSMGTRLPRLVSESPHSWSVSRSRFAGKEERV